MDEFEFDEDESIDHDEYFEDECPDCGEVLVAQLSGVKCKCCGYWFCY